MGVVYKIQHFRLLAVFINRVNSERFIVDLKVLLYANILDFTM